MKSTAHGSFHLTWKSNVLAVNIGGAFNKEGVDSLHKSIELAVNDSYHSEWFRVDFIECIDTLGPLSVFPDIVCSLKFCAINGCRHLYMVGGSSLICSIITSAAKEASIPITNFKTKEEAIQHLPQLN